MKYLTAIATSLLISSLIFMLNLDEKIPMHFDITGTASRFGDKAIVFLESLVTAFVCLCFFLDETAKRLDMSKKVFGYLFYIVMSYLIIGPLYSLFFSKKVFNEYHAVSPIFIFPIILAFAFYFRKELKST